MNEVGIFFEDLSAKKNVECHFHNQGYCKYADKCAFLHNEKTGYNKRYSNKSATAINVPVQKKESRQATNDLCVFFFRGKCKAQPCSFLHAFPAVEYAKSSGNSEIQSSSTQEVLLMVIICFYSKNIVIN